MDCVQGHPWFEIVNPTLRIIALMSSGGTMGGISLVAVGHPFDTVKGTFFNQLAVIFKWRVVRLQTQPLDNPMFSGMTDCIKKTWSMTLMYNCYLPVNVSLQDMKAWVASIVACCRRSLARYSSQCQTWISL